MQKYGQVVTRFLRQEERLILSDEQEMPLVIEAKSSTDLEFLHHFLKTNSEKLLEDVATYGAVLFRGFEVNSNETFENTILSIEGLQGISDAFMSEEGRTHPDNSNYVLHTNAIYKTGGTLYLGGFHTENYYGADVPAYISFCCLKHSLYGGETGLINMEKIYQDLDSTLQKKLEEHTFFVSKWLVSEVAKRYDLSEEAIEKFAKDFDLPLLGEGKDQFMLMYKPSVIENIKTKKRALHINLFELPTLNKEIRKLFTKDYQGKRWFWHRFVWRFPDSVLKILEYSYYTVAQLIHSPKNAFKVLFSELSTKRAAANLPAFNNVKVNSCFNEQEIKKLAQLIRKYYSSCLWQKGDILLVDNRKVAHAGMPGSGPRLIRAMICNPIEMKYSSLEPGCIESKERHTGSIASFITSGGHLDD